MRGAQNNVSFCYSFINKICFASVNVSFLLPIKICTFLNVFASFRYRISSISKALLSKTFIICKFFAGLPEPPIYSFTPSPIVLLLLLLLLLLLPLPYPYPGDRTDAGQEGCRTGRMKDRTDAGLDRSRTEWMKDRTGQIKDRTGQIKDR